MQYSVVNLGKTITAPNFRLDAEFYHPFYLESEQLISSKNNDNLGNLITILTDYHANGSYKILRGNVKILDSQDYALMIRTVDFEKDDFENNVKYVSEHAYNFLKKTKVFGGEIIINKIGNAGKVYLVPPLDKKITLGMNQFMIRPKNNLNNYFLYVFLVCKYGRLLLEQRITGAVPLSIDKESVRSVPVPILKDEFQEIIEKIVEKYFTLSNQSKNFYQKAEQLLLSELGLLNWKPKHELSFVKNFSATLEAERFDAEYFQPKYEKIIEAVKKHKGGFETLENLTKLIGHPSNPPYEIGNAENKTFIITQKHLANYFPADNFWKDEDALYTTDEFIEKNKKFILQKNDVILYSVGASYIGKVNFYNANIKATIGSFLTLIRPKVEKINPFYLLVFLNSKIGHEFTRRNLRGAIQQYIYPYDTRQVIIPILEISKQKKIENLILEGQRSHNVSKSLLEIAKRGVEMAIEKDEQEAGKWIESEIEKLDIKI